MSNCLNDKGLLRLLKNEMDVAALAAADSHLQTCRRCALRLEKLSSFPEESEWRQRRKVSNAPKPSGDLGNRFEILFPPAAAPGSIGRLERFDIKAKLGQGAMGGVFLAHDSRLKRRVAIKVIKPALAAQPEYVELFKREAYAAARVDSPYVVRIVQVETGAANFPLPFLVMEFIEGKTLREFIAAEEESPESQAPPLDFRRLAEIARDVAQGLAAIHAKGLVHRDIKPANILLDAASGNARITDFGLARSVEGSEARMTESSTSRGTPAYMSPEQFTDPAQIDGRSDVFSFGVVLYELLTGRRPFPGENIEKIALQVTTQTPGAPRSIDPEIPYDLETICLACLDKDVRYRYAGATAVADDLDRFLTHRPILCKRPSIIRRIWLFARRNRDLMKLAAIFVGIAILGAAGWSYEVSNERAKTKKASTDADTQSKIAKAQTKAAEEAKELAKIKSALAEQQTKLAETAKELAKSKSKLAEQNAQEAAIRKERERRTRYLSQMRNAYKAWESAAPREARLLLDQQAPPPSSVEPDLRGVEWYYLDHNMKGNHRPLDFGMGGQAVCFSPEGDRVAAFGEGDRNVYCVKLWKWPYPKPERVLKLIDEPSLTFGSAGQVPHLAGPEMVAFNHDGTMVAATAYFHTEKLHEGIVKVWEVETGRMLFSVSDRAIAGWAVKFTPDGDDIVAGGYNNAALGYSIAAGKLRWTLPGFESNTGYRSQVAREIARPGKDVGTNVPVDHLLFSPDGNYLTRIGGYSNTLGNRAQWRPERRPSLNPMAGYGNAFSQDADSFNSGRTETMAAPLAFSRCWGLLPDVNLDGVRLFQPLDGSGDRMPITTDEPVPNSPRKHSSIKLDQGTIKTVALAGSHLAIADRRSNLIIIQFDVNTGIVEERKILRGHQGDIDGLAFSADWEKLAAIGHDSLTVWEDLFRPLGADVFDIHKDDASERDINKYRWVSPRGSGPVTRSRDGTRVALTSLDPRSDEPARKTSIYILDAVANKMIRELALSHPGPYELALNKSGKMLLSSAYHETTMRLWDTDSGSILHELKSQGYGISRAEFSPDGKWLVTGNNTRKEVVIWDVDTGKSVDRFTLDHSRSIWAFHDQMVALPIEGKRIFVWDMNKREKIGEYNGLDRDLKGLAFLDEGQRFLAYYEGLLTLWTLDEPSQICSFPAPKETGWTTESIANSLRRLGSSAKR